MEKVSISQKHWWPTQPNQHETNGLHHIIVVGVEVEDGLVSESVYIFALLYVKHGGAK